MPRPSRSSAGPCTVTSNELSRRITPSPRVTCAGIGIRFSSCESPFASTADGIAIKNTSDKKCFTAMPYSNPRTPAPPTGHYSTAPRPLPSPRKYPVQLLRRRLPPVLAQLESLRPPDLPFPVSRPQYLAHRLRHRPAPRVAQPSPPLA